MSRRSSISRRFAKRYRAHRPLFQLAFILAGSAVVIAGVFFGIRGLKDGLRPRQDALAETAQPENVPPIERVFELTAGSPSGSEISDITELILKAYGGREAVHQFVAERRIGQAHAAASGGHLTVSYVWKAPHFMRYSLRHEETGQQFVTNGERIWHTFFRNGEAVRETKLEGPDRARFLRNLAMSEPAPRAVLEIDQLSLLPPETINGRHCHVIARQHPDFVEALYFDQRHFLCLRRIRDDSDLLENWGETWIDFADYRDIDGLVVPFSQTTWIAGEKSLEFETKEFQSNPGLLSTLFSEPGAL